MVEHDRDRRWLTTWWCDLSAPGEARVIFDRSADDAYGDPGSPMLTVHPDGAQTVLSDGNAIYLRGPALPTSAGSTACRASIEGLGASASNCTACLRRHWVK